MVGFYCFLFLFLLRAFEDLQVFWRATFSKEAVTLLSNGVNLTSQLLQTSGTAVCRRGEILCVLSLEVLNDEVKPPAKTDMLLQPKMKRLVK